MKSKTNRSYVNSLLAC